MHFEIHFEQGFGWKVLAKDYLGSGGNYALISLTSIGYNCGWTAADIPLIEKYAREIAYQLDQLEPWHTESKQAYQAFWEAFLSSNWMGVQFDIDKELNPNYVLTCFWRGIYQFLISRNLFREKDASLPLLWAAWQWYNLVKEQVEQEPGEKGGVQELARAHGILVGLLRSTFPGLVAARRLLVEKIRSDVEDSEITPLISEQMLLSLYVQNKQHSKNKSAANQSKTGFSSGVAYAPGIGERLQWSNICLHPAFKDESSILKEAVRQFGVRTLLANYNLEEAVHLSILLRHPQGIFSTPIWLIAILIMLLAALPVAVVNISGVQMPLACFWILAIYILWFGLAVFWIFDWRSLLLLSLPRLFGGILVGYTFLLLEESSSHIAESLFQAWPSLGSLPLSIILLFAGTAIICLLYFFADTLPLVGPRQWRTALYRSLSILIVSLTATLFIGLFTSTLFTSWFVLPCSSTLHNAWLMGPIGAVNYKIWLSFAPFALLAGLVTQLIFQERAVSDPVWQTSRE